MLYRLAGGGDAGRAQQLLQLGERVALLTPVGDADRQGALAGARVRNTGATHAVIGYPIESWVKVMEVNVNGLFYCCRFVAPLMVENGYGRIVNISSVAGKEGNPNQR